MDEAIDSVGVPQPEREPEEAEESSSLLEKVEAMEEEEEEGEMEGAQCVRRKDLITCA
jgi:hypothetical protein